MVIKKNPLSPYKKQSVPMLILLFWLCPFGLIGQGQYIIVTILNETKNNIHPVEIDYWLIDIKKWIEPSSEALVPLFLYGYSDQDFLECIQEDKLVFFNAHIDETFEMTSSLEKSFLKLVNDNKILVSKSINRKQHRKTKIRVYFTLVEGDFKYCNIANLDSADTGYCGKMLALPINFVASEISGTIVDQIKKYPFFRLPYLGLNTL